MTKENLKTDLCRLRQELYVYIQAMLESYELGTYKRDSIAVKTVKQLEGEITTLLFSSISHNSSMYDFTDDIDNV